ncbi:hypothetical protein LFL96_23285 [Paraburkholderia sp. D15]|uniref:hypothetical protein n=1 Tax=Paraburkholderia sp. D15 TaxID=2880218 RepID=UPI002479E88A|nr:hypothetical protein [Paraburkholderia sp. D15]WGS53965.1 hypothetical protein LFL96_23285 [Paraburkholderia sp. D15]
MIYSVEFDYRSNTRPARTGGSDIDLLNSLNAIFSPASKKIFLLPRIRQFNMTPARSPSHDIVLMTFVMQFLIDGFGDINRELGKTDRPKKEGALQAESASLTRRVGLDASIERSRRVDF